MGQYSSAAAEPLFTNGSVVQRPATGVFTQLYTPLSLSLRMPSYAPEYPKPSLNRRLQLRIFVEMFIGFIGLRVYLSKLLSLTLCWSSSPLSVKQKLGYVTIKFSLIFLLIGIFAKDD